MSSIFASLSVWTMLLALSGAVGIAAAAVMYRRCSALENRLAELASATPAAPVATVVQPAPASPAVPVVSVASVPPAPFAAASSPNPGKNNEQRGQAKQTPLHDIHNVMSLSEMALELSEAGYWCMSSEQSGMVYLSDRLVSFSGLEPREGNLYDFEHDVLPLIGAEDLLKASEVRTNVVALQQGRATRYESQHRFRRLTDNEVLWVQFAARAERNAFTKQVSVFGVLQNITRIKLVEMNLAEERWRLQTLFDSSTVGLLIAENGMVRQVNPYLHKMIGISVGDNPYDYFYGPLVSRERVRARLEETGGQVTGAEVFVRDRNNEERVLLTSYHRAYTEGQETILAWFVDLTDIKRAQAAYIAARDAAESAVQAKSRFLANVSHEIRTPMNAIIGLTYLVLQTVLTPKQRADLEKIERSSKALLQLLNDILDVSRIEAGKLELANNEFTLHEVLLNLANLLAMETERKGLELEFRIASGVPPTVRGDALRLGQVLMNLTGNAVKFTDKGSVLVCVDVESRSEKGIVLRFSVQDSGIGISEDKLANLFEHFTQADASSTRRFGGTGLGLSISKSLVELMGGRMHVVSKLGEGSTFSFVIPFNLENLQPHEVGLAPQDIRGTRILVVDDTPLARGVVGECLQRMHFRVDLVESGQHALEAVTRADQADTPYKYVLTDWKMPDMDGLEVSRRIAFEEDLRQRPTMLMMTAHISGNIFARAELAGIRRVLLKPVTPSALMDALIDLSSASGTGNVAAGYTVIDPGSDVTLPPGLRILLAEDNPINQQVVREVLESAGVRVDMASNGGEAVQLVREVAYDLVLMDIQMPEMDGITAVRLLREQPQFKNLPIIAMTAHAMPEDRDKSCAAGMNEHITKPIDPHEMFCVIRKWVHAGKAAGATNAVASPLPPVLQDLPGINAQSALDRLGGNVPLYISLLQDYHTRFMHLCRVASQYIDAGEYEAAKLLFHEFKGCSASLGASTLAQSAASVESALRNGHVDAQIRVAMEALQARLNEVMQGLAHLIPLAEGHTDAQEVSRDDIFAVLCEAHKLIQLNSPEASSVLGSAHAQLSARLPREMERLCGALDNFDFETAKDALGVVLKKMDMQLPG